MKYYIAVDGGGTKLQAILYNEKYDIVKTARSAGGHYGVVAQVGTDSEVYENAC